MVLEFPSVLLNVGDDRHRGRIAQWAERAPEHVLRQVLQVVDIFRHTAAGMEARQRLLHPVGALAAGNTPAATLVLIKLGDPQRELDNAHLIVEHDYTA